MITSILDSVKKVLNLEPEDNSFDEDVLLHINTVFSDLHQLGVGPEEGFMIQDDSATWDQFLGDDLTVNNVKSYVYLRVRMLFDPPQTGYLVDAMDKQIEKMEWKINAKREETEWVDPDPPIPILWPL